MENKYSDVKAAEYSVEKKKCKSRQAALCMLLTAVLLCVPLSGCSTPSPRQDVSAAEFDTGTAAAIAADLAAAARTDSAAEYATQDAAASATDSAAEYATERAAASSTELSAEYATQAASVSATESAAEYATDGAADSLTGAAAYANPEHTDSEKIQISAVIEEAIRVHVENMSLEEKVSGLFILTPEALTGYGAVTEAGDATYEALQSTPVAGLIYFPGNIQSREQLSGMLENTLEWGAVNLEIETSDSSSAEKNKETIRIAPFLAVDEEGGLVARVADSGIGFPNVGDMGTIGASGDPEAAFEAGSTIGGYLSEVGFNMDFAPDADVLIDPYNETIGNRSFGADPVLCGQMVGRFIDGLHAYGIGACIKHFPGLGDTETDTHTGGAWSSRSIDDYRGAEFISFSGGIEAGTDMVMVSHLTNTVLSGSDLPASLNKAVITGILRDELGYNGIIITDSLQMGAVTERFDSADAAVTAIDAGVDILLMPADFQSARQGVLDAVGDGRLSEERINESIYRILLTRYSLGRK